MMKLEEAQKKSAEIIATIQDLCDRVEVVGSIRRKRAEVNDIDIVAIPRGIHSTLDPSHIDRSITWHAIASRLGIELGAKAVKSGEQIHTLDVNGIQVDIYRATSENWGALLLVRTGSADHNIYLCNLAITKGLRLQYSRGLIDKEGHVVAGKTEEEIFEALELPFIPPQEREISNK